MSRRAGFTLIELLVILGILSMLLTIILPSYGAVQRFAEKINCAGNLKAIGSSITGYFAEHIAYPATANDFDRSASGTWQGAGSENIAPDEDQAREWLFSDTAQKAVCPSASFFLLVRSGDLSTGAFVCVSDRQAHKYRIPPGESLEVITDFESMTNVSYSVSYLWNHFDTDTKTNNVDVLKPHQVSSFALVSDLSPVGISPDADVQADDERGNSWNHGQEGQNVLYADAHVVWHKNNRAGINGDNIFTRSADNGVPASVAGDGGSGANPSDTSDTVMCFYGRQ